MRVAVITTVRHNVGDDFVREGILHLLERRFGRMSVELIHKHAPVTVRRGFERVRRRRSSTLLDSILPTMPAYDRILSADMLVQSGAPVYWCHDDNHCSQNEWFEPLVRRRYYRVRDRVPFLNLAAGSAQRYGSTGEEVRECARDLEYIREIHAAANVTTVRDPLAQNILRFAGQDAPVIPCASIFGRHRLRIEPKRPEYVALNFMDNGGHYTLGQAIDSSKWLQTFREFYSWLSARERCVFVCHNEAEVRAARSVDSAAEVFISSRYQDYLEMYSRARLGIMNRVHGAFALASFGRPSFVIGTDSRAEMSSQIGLRHAFVATVTTAQLISEFERLAASLSDYERQFEAIRGRAEAAYDQALARI